MRVLITGIGGSIGCHVLAHLIEHTDWEIVGIDSFRHKGLTDRVAVVLNETTGFDDQKVTIFTHDLIAPISPILAEKMGPIDHIINLASLSDVQLSIDEPGPFILNNVQITTTILDYARTQKLKSFVHFSTDEVYGPAGPYGAHKEWSTILPSNPYAASKAAQEAIAIAYWRSYGVPLIITNTMNNFGEMQQASKFPAMVQRYVTKGDVVPIHGNLEEIGSRFYIHSRNTADAILFILNNVKPHLHEAGAIDCPDRFNIVGDKRLNNLELAQLIAKYLDKPLYYDMIDYHAARPGHDRHYGLDGSLLHQLGWRSPISFEESMHSTLIWTQEHPEWLK